MLQQLPSYLPSQILSPSCPSYPSCYKSLNSYQERGIDGVSVKQRSGRPRRIPKGQFVEEIVPLVLDNASWHHAASLKWHHITPKFLPPYSPDLNPIEVLWLCFKQRTFTGWYAKSFDQLLDRTVHGLRNLFLDPDSVASITSFSR